MPCLRLRLPIGLLLLLGSAAVATAQRAEPQQQLRTLGLTPLGRTWLCEDERLLREHLEEVDRLERPFFVARDRHQTLLAQYEIYQTKIKQIEALREQNKTRLKQTSSANLAGRQQLESEGRRLDESLSQVEKSVREELDAGDEHSPLTASAIELTNARNALAVTVLAVHRHHARMRQCYAELQGDPQTGAALAALGPEATLGPIENYSLLLPRRLDRLSEAVFTDTLPFYRRSGQFRISLIVNERAPMTFSYLAAEDGPTMIPASLAQLAGLTTDEAARRKQFEFGARTVAGREVVIPQLRLGRFVIRDVPAWVLPPEAEDLGARLTPAAFEHYQPDLDPKRLELRLTPAGPSSP